MSNKASNQSTLYRCIKAPIRILSKARDFYIRSMADCAGRVSYGEVMGLPTGHICTLPKSFSVNSSRSSNDEDLRELVRAASKKSLQNKVEMELRLLQQQQQSSPMVNGVPRSYSVGIGRIDEDKPCDFGEDVKMTDLVYPRSRSYAVTKRPGVFA